MGHTNTNKFLTLKSLMQMIFQGFYALIKLLYRTPLPRDAETDMKHLSN